MDDNGFYVVEQGVIDPRSNGIGWRPWSNHNTKESALAEAKGMTIYRVLRCEVIREQVRV